MNTSQEHNRIINECVREQMEAIDATAWGHWCATSHTPLLTTFPIGWTCPNCPESFVLKPIEVR